MAITDTNAINYEGRLSAIEERSKSQATKEDLATLKADLIALKADLIKWFIGTQVAQAALIMYLV